MNEPSASSPFDDLVTANRTFAAAHDLSGLEGVARAGVAVVTCMDARIDPLAMIGLTLGDAKILRNPGGQVTDDILLALAVAVNLLGVNRVLVVQHTRCAMASATESELRQRLAASSGHDTSWLTIGVIADQRASLTDGVAKVRAHPLVPPSVEVGGFLYDVDTGLLEQIA